MTYLQTSLSPQLTEAPDLPPPLSGENLKIHVANHAVAKVLLFARDVRCSGGLLAGLLPRSFSLSIKCPCK